MCRLKACSGRSELTALTPAAERRFMLLSCLHPKIVPHDLYFSVLLLYRHIQPRYCISADNTAKSTLCKVKVRFSLNPYLMGSWKPSCQLNWVQPRSHNCSNWKKIMTLNGWSNNRPSKTPVPPLTDIILLDSFVLSNLQPATWVQLPAQEQLHARLHSLGSAEYSHYNSTLKTDCFLTGRRTDCKCEGEKKVLLVATVTDCRC